MKLRLQQHERNLDDLFLIVKGIKEEELQAYLSKFLCVRTSGLLESAIKNLISEYIQKSTPKPIQNYVSKAIKSCTNLKDEKLISTLKSFSDEWAEELIAQITDEQRSALNSVVTNRNNIAHGENDNITFKAMENYYLKTKEVIEILKTIIKK